MAILFSQWLELEILGVISDSTFSHTTISNLSSDSVGSNLKFASPLATSTTITLVQKMTNSLLSHYTSLPTYFPAFVLAPFQSTVIINSLIIFLYPRPPMDLYLSQCKSPSSSYDLQMICHIWSVFLLLHPASHLYPISFNSFSIAFLLD